MSPELMLIETPDQAAVLMKPLRIALLGEMYEPRSCRQLAEALETTPQKIYYHVKMMEQAGLVCRDGERVINGITEGFYRACARSFWFSPRMTRSHGRAERLRDETSLGVLAGHAEEMLEEVGRLGERTQAGEHVPSLSLSVKIDLQDARRRGRFLAELQRTFEHLAHRYTGSDRGDPDGRNTFRFTIACYPQAAEEDR